MSTRGPGRRWVLEQSLTLFFLVIFLLALVGQSVAGLALYNDAQLVEGYATVSWLHYVTSPDFAVDVVENWQSEYLQFLVFIFATVWLVQRGSTESKKVDERGVESAEEQKLGRFAESDSPAWARAGGWRATVFSNSLGIVMGATFVLTWAAQYVAGWVAFNEERLGRLQEPLAWYAYGTAADFWSRTLQNWQSEFLAVGSMVVFSIYLRQRGSAQSKPVGEPHETTAASG